MAYPPVVQLIEPWLRDPASTEIMHDQRPEERLDRTRRVDATGALPLSVRPAAPERDRRHRPTFERVLLFALLAVGCGSSSDSRAFECLDSTVSVDFPHERVDILLVVHAGPSMVEEQGALGELMSHVVRILTTGDVDLDGVQDFASLQDLHVGVVTSDMGAGGFAVATCEDEPRFGDDGLLRAAGDTGDPACGAAEPGFLAFAPGDDTASFSSAVPCLANVGTRGCAFGQPLEAALKALTPSASSISFQAATVGHGDTDNAGFLRADSTLLVIIGSDEDDCSAAEPELFDPASARYSGEMSLRCFEHAEALHDLTRFVDGFLALATGRPTPVILAAVAGVPVDLVAGSSEADFDAILADPRMEARIDETMPTRLAPVCDVPGRGTASPARRLVTAVRDLDQRGGSGAVSSICQPDALRIVGAITEKLVGTFAGVCLEREVPRDDDGRVSCDVLEILPAAGPITRCEALATMGRDPVSVRTEPDGREVCRVRQLACTGAITCRELGWFYDDALATMAGPCPGAQPQVVFPPGAHPTPGSTIEVTCTDVVLEHVDAAGVGLGTHCDPGARGDSPCADSERWRDLVCEPLSRTCQIPCLGASQCPDGLACDARRGVCIRPACSVSPDPGPPSS